MKVKNVYSKTMFILGISKNYIVVIQECETKTVLCLRDVHIYVDEQEPWKIVKVMKEAINVREKYFV